MQIDCFEKNCCFLKGNEQILHFIGEINFIFEKHSLQNNPS
jgi:hypothetical protein